jgi:hypothetical protein
MKSKPVTRIGFDFDGVIFYNATRNLRAFIYFVKRYLFGITKTKFYIPAHPISRQLAYFLHGTSAHPNTGFKDFLKMIKDPGFEIYIITARPSFMKENIHDKLKGFDLSGIKQIIQNKKDEQPHLYKEALIKKLKLDYFVDDNWDIVKHLSETTRAKVVWVDNMIDSWFIKHPYKGRNLKEAIKTILKTK